MPLPKAARVLGVRAYLPELRPTPPVGNPLCRITGSGDGDSATQTVATGKLPAVRGIERGDHQVVDEFAVHFSVAEVVDGLVDFGEAAAAGDGVLEVIG